MNTPENLLDALKSDDVAMRVAGVMEILWQSEAMARTVLLAQGKLKDIVQNIPADQHIVRDIYAVIRLSETLAAYLHSEQARLNLELQQQQKQAQPQTEEATSEAKPAPVIH